MITRTFSLGFALCIGALAAPAGAQGLESLKGVCAASTHWLLYDWATQSFARKSGVLLATMIAAGSVFVGVGAALGLAELNELIDAVRRRLFRGNNRAS